MVIVGSGRRGRFLRFRSLGALTVPCVGVVDCPSTPPNIGSRKGRGGGRVLCVSGKGSVCDSLFACPRDSSFTPHFSFPPPLRRLLHYRPREHRSPSLFLLVDHGSKNFIRPHPRTQNLYTSSCIRSGPRVSCWAPSCTLALETYSGPTSLSLSLLSYTSLFLSPKREGGIERLTPCLNGFLTQTQNYLQLDVERVGICAHKARAAGQKKKTIHPGPAQPHCPLLNRLTCLGFSPKQCTHKREREMHKTLGSRSRGIWISK